MQGIQLFLVILVMTLVTYLPRVLPIAIFRRQIQNRFIQSFLLYMPYGVLSAMVFPAVLMSTGNLTSAVIGTLVALAMSYQNLGLLPVAIGSTAAVFLAEQLLPLLF